MEQTAIKSGPPPSPIPSSTAITANPERLKPLAKEKGFLYGCLEVAASLRVTVVLFTFAIVLVYYGTWAQKDAGIWTVVKEYFRSFYVWIPLHTVLMRSVSPETVAGYAIPFPGGWLIGSLLLLNLVAAHAVRFKVSWKRSGILLIHSGLIVMMLGELLTGMFAVERKMYIMVGNSAHWVERDRAAEFAIVDRSDPREDKEVVISPERFKQGGTIEDERLPFNVEVLQYMANTRWKMPDASNRATAGIGLQRIALSIPEGTGVDTAQGPDYQSAYVTLKDKATGKSLGTFLVSTYFSYIQRPMEEVKVGGKRYAFALRLEREYRDYALQLLQFRHDTYLGTEIARNFQSDVRIIDLLNPMPPQDEKKGDAINEDANKGAKDKKNAKPAKDTITIWMNHPLFYQGETFYQASVHEFATGTGLQVVLNPAWWLPYVSCILVTVGMLVHFGLHLTSFLKRRQVV